MINFNSNNDFLNEDKFQERTRAALSWLKKSYDVNSGNGSSAYYSQLWKPFGWSLAYPETTGYIIETLFDYDSLFPDMDLNAYGIKGSDWICSLQLEGGALPGGFSNSKAPSIFNTGQMIIGLVRAFELTGDEKYYRVFKDAAYWLSNNVEKDGSWKVGAYVDSYTPSYYTRVIWPVLWANKHIKDEAITASMRKALAFYQAKKTDKWSIRDWSFKAGQKAFTHTIAYTIRGFYESSVLLEDKELNDFSIKLAEKVLTLRELKGSLAGWYDLDWNGDYWFTCLTGNCQMSIIFNRIYEQTGDLRFLNTALKVFEDIIPHQNMGSSVNKRGALPGSAPFYGRYLALRYPNWATKFFLDAYLRLKKNVGQLDSKISK